jgi:hypothetical protein
MDYYICIRRKCAHAAIVVADGGTGGGHRTVDLGGGDGGEKAAGHAVTQPDSATCSVNSSFGSVRPLPKDTGHPTTIRCPRTRSRTSPDADADIPPTPQTKDCRNFIT